MAQDRMLRAELRISEKANEWPIPVRYFWTQLWGYCDDWGRGRFDARLIKADTFPLDDEVSAEVIKRWMQALEIAEVIARYEVNGKQYFECVNWFEHQEITYLKKTNIPDRAGLIPPPGKRSGKVQKGSDQGEVKGKGIEVEREGESATGAPPSEFCTAHPNGTTSKCGACGDARRASRARAKHEAQKPTSRPPRKGECNHVFIGGYCHHCSEREIAA